MSAIKRAPSRRCIVTFASSTIEANRDSVIAFASHRVQTSCGQYYKSDYDALIERGHIHQYQAIANSRNEYDTQYGAAHATHPAEETGTPDYDRRDCIEDQVLCDDGRTDSKPCGTDDPCEASHSSADTEDNHASSTNRNACDFCRLTVSAHSVDIEAQTCPRQDES